MEVSGGRSTPPPLPPPSTLTFGKQGRILHGQAREIVANVITFMKNEAENVKRDNQPLIPLTHFRERILAATGITPNLYTAITREAKAIATGAATSFVTPRSPKKKRPRKRKYELVEVVEGEEHPIRTIVYEFDATEKKMPTIAGEAKPKTIKKC